MPLSGKVFRILDLVSRALLTMWPAAHLESPQCRGRWIGVDLTAANPARAALQRPFGGRSNDLGTVISEPRVLPPSSDRARHDRME
uniref:Putative secreted protein n=1 Tax=Anopheles marajoara TaxID=58244 RepID=A0A2M4CAI7_9DIPT